MIEILVEGRDSLYQQFVGMGCKDRAWEYKKWLVKTCGVNFADITTITHHWSVEDLSDGVEVYFQTLEAACKGLLFYAEYYKRDNFTIHELWM
jgi:hypothetical protein